MVAASGCELSTLKMRTSYYLVSQGLACFSYNKKEILSATILVLKQGMNERLLSIGSQATVGTVLKSISDQTQH